MTSLQLYIDTAKIENETELTFQEHKVQELITKQIHLANDGYSSINLLAILISLGAMVISLAALTNPDTDIYAYASAATILLASIGFALYERNKQNKNQEFIQRQIIQTMIAIHAYKKCKEEVHKSQNKKEIAEDQE